jgi:hypothetical protein
MTYFGGRSVDPTPEIPIQDNPSADSRAQRYTDDRLVAPTGALPHFADGSGICIVLKNGTPLQFALKRGS